MDKLIEYLPFILPILIIQLALTITALVHVLRHRNYRFGSRPLWIVISFISIIGPVIYFVFGRGED